MYWLFDRSPETTLTWIEQKFKAHPPIVAANTASVKAGYNFGETAELFTVRYQISRAAIEPGRVIVLYPREFTQNGSAWVFFLDELDEGTTRLIARFRFDYKPSPGNKLGYNFLLEPISCLMQRKMLLGIKQQAEAALVASTKKGG